jgi:hypothetical protein
MALSGDEVEQAEAKANLWYGGAQTALRVQTLVQEARRLLSRAKAEAQGEVDGEFACWFDKQGQLVADYCQQSN